MCDEQSCATGWLRQLGPFVPLLRLNQLVQNKLTTNQKFAKKFTFGSKVTGRKSGTVRFYLQIYFAKDAGTGF